MKLSNQQIANFNRIELRIIFQRAIEIIDDINYQNTPSRNKKLESQIKALYPSLDKETKKYDELFNATEIGTTHFYDIVRANCSIILSNHILDKSFIASFLIAHEKNPKAVEGIINKILKNEKRL